MAALVLLTPLLILISVTLSTSRKTRDEGCCPDYWVKFGHSCYKLIIDKYRWHDAQAVCKTLDSTLVNIGSTQEDKFVKDLSHNEGVSVWIGLSDVVQEGSFVWIDTQEDPKYTNWFKGEPDNYKGTEDCVELAYDHGGKWKDADCENKFSLVCEKPSDDDVYRPASCVDVKKYVNVSGVHTIFVNGNKPVKVYCDQSTDNGGWTVIQRRQDGSVDFYRNWEQYEKGFGDLNGEFWIGLDNLHQLTKSKTVKLRVDLTDFNGSTYYAVYNTFSISGADDNYRLNVGGYSGTAGDSLEHHNTMKFTTFDRDNDNYDKYNCATKNHGGWWYACCAHSNLNGRYNPVGASEIDGVYWFGLLSWRSLKRVELKITE